MEWWVILDSSRILRILYVEFSKSESTFLTRITFHQLSNLPRPLSNIPNNANTNFTLI